MYIAYRRTGGVLALLTFAAIVLAVTVLTVAVAVAVLVAALAVAAAALIARAVRPTWSWRHTAPPAIPSPLETIEMTVVRTSGPSVDRDLVRIDSGKN